MTTTTKRYEHVADLRRLHVHRHAGIFRPLEGDERERLRASMRTSGYDDVYPIVIWNKTREIVDGRNRRDLAVELGLVDVPVVEHDFADEKAVAEFIVAANLARRHLDARERRELAGRLVVNGLSTRQAANAANVSEATARRAATVARSGASDDAPAAERVVGADGKRYPATKTRSKPKATDRRSDEIAFQYRAMRDAQSALRRLVLGCVVTGRVGRDRYRGRVTEFSFDDAEGDAWVSLDDDEESCLRVAQITAVEKLPARATERRDHDASTNVDLVGETPTA